MVNKVEELIIKLENSAKLNDIIKKAEYILSVQDLTAALLKGGKKADIGETRTWSSGTYTKHSDGWVKVGGAHHGKLMGKFKVEAKPEHSEFARKIEGIGVPKIEPILVNTPKQKETISSIKAEGMKTESLSQITYNSLKGVPTGKPSKVPYIPPVNDKSNLVGFVAFGKSNIASQKALNEKLQSASIILTEMGIRLKTPIDFTCQNVNAKARRVTQGVYYELRHHDKNPLIDIKNKDHQTRTLLHEIGHAVDYSLNAETEKDFSSKLLAESPELEKKVNELFKEVKLSPFYQAKDQSFKRYISKPTEIFARAFEVHSYKVAQDLIKEGKLSEDVLHEFIPAILSGKSDEAREKYIKDNKSPKVVEMEAKLADSLALITKEYDIFLKKLSESGMSMDAYINTPEGGKVWTVYHEIQGQFRETGIKLRKDIFDERVLLVAKYSEEYKFRADAEPAVEKISKLMEDILKMQKIEKGQFLNIDLKKT